MKKAPVEFNTTPNPNFASVSDVDAKEVLENKNQVHLIDVRRPDEYTGELGHIPGAKLIVLDTLPDYIDDLPKDEPIVFICKSGGRSAQASAFAAQNGFEHTFNMKGGMMHWNQLGFETSKAED